MQTFRRVVLGLGTLTLLHCTGTISEMQSDGGTGADASTASDAGLDSGSVERSDAGGDAGIDGGAPDAGSVEGRDAGPQAPPQEDRCTPPTLPPVPTALRTLWVDSANGLDSNDGRSAATAWRSLAKANAGVQPGDEVFVTGFFDGGYLRPGSSGTAANPIVFRVPDGGSATLANPEYGVSLWVSGLSYVVFEGFTFSGTGAAVDFVDNRHVWVRHSTILSRGSARLIGSDDNRFEANVWPRCGDSCVFLTSGSSRNVIAGNRFGDSDSITLYLASPAETPAVDNVIEGNDLGNTLDGQVALTGSALRTTLACNVLHDSGKGLRDGGGPAPGLTVMTSGNQVLRNVFHGHTGEAIRVQAFAANPASDNVLAHNVVWGTGGPGLRFLLSEVGAQLEGNLVENNILWGNNSSTDFHWTAEGVRYKVVFDFFHAQLSGYADGGLGGNVVRNNLIGRDEGDRDGGWLYVIGYGRNAVFNLSQAQQQFPAMSDNVEAEPAFFDAGAGDFRLSAGSPAVDRGHLRAGEPFQGTAPDLGRFETTP